MILTDCHTETNITTSRDGMPHFSWAHRQKRESTAPRKFTFTVNHVCPVKWFTYW